MKVHTFLTGLMIFKQMLTLVVTSSTGELRFYNELSTQLSEKIGVTRNRLTAISPRSKRSVLPTDHPVLAKLGINSSEGQEEETISLQANIDSNDGLVKFHLPKDLTTLTISKAKLYIHTPEETITKKKAFLVITLLNTITNKNTTVIRRIPRQTSKDGWYSVKSLTEPLTEVINQYKQTSYSLNMIITCPDCESLTSALDNPPVLVIQGSKEVMAADEASSKCVGSCCVQPLVVDFDKLGYDWIIYPRQYVANYCEGNCNGYQMPPHERGQLSVNTNIIQAMLNKLGSKHSGSCCVPKSATPVRIVFQDRHGVIRSDTSTLKTVTSCHCS